MLLQKGLRWAHQSTSKLSIDIIEKDKFNRFHRLKLNTTNARSTRKVNQFPLRIPTDFNILSRSSIIHKLFPVVFLLFPTIMQISSNFQFLRQTQSQLLGCGYWRKEFFSVARGGAKVRNHCIACNDKKIGNKLLYFLNLRYNILNMEFQNRSCFQQQLRITKQKIDDVTNKYTNIWRHMKTR